MPPHCDVHVPPGPCDSMHKSAVLAHAMPLQHGWPSPPHAMHVSPTCELGQVAFDAVHPPQPLPVDPHEAVEASLQHGCPTPPQLPQLPCSHVPRLCGQEAPGATHESSTQHAPSPQPNPRQQA
jgi:hypothetical protein